MNTMTETARLAVAGKQRMTPSEAFVETLVAQGVKDVFGIVGSAYMDALDLFPLAGIRFISVAHEQGGGHMADGYARVSGRHGVCIAQNGPGHHQLRHRYRCGVLGALAGRRGYARDRLDDPRAWRLPGDRAAPDLLEDHEVPGAREQPCAHGGAHGPRVRSRAARDGAERNSTSRATSSTATSSARFRGRSSIERGAGGEKSLDEAAELLASAQFPVILAGGGVVMGDAAGRDDAARRAAAGAGVQLATCTTIRSRRGIRCGAGRSATRARRPR